MEWADSADVLLVFAKRINPEQAHKPLIEQ
jgi:hypothetical protein